VVPVNGEEVCGKYIWTKGRVGEDRGSKETDRCPLTIAGHCHITTNLPNPAVSHQVTILHGLRRMSRIKPTKLTKLSLVVSLMITPLMSGQFSQTHDHLWPVISHIQMRHVPALYPDFNWL
jgi:hypothetical protein